MALAFAPDGRVFFGELSTGTIRIVGNGDLLPNPFYTIPDTATGVEGGLLGLAFDPQFPVSPWVYAYQTFIDSADGNTYNRVVRIEADGNTGLSHESLSDSYEWIVAVVGRGTASPPFVWWIPALVVIGGVSIILAFWLWRRQR